MLPKDHLDRPTRRNSQGREKTMLHVVVINSKQQIQILYIYIYLSTFLKDIAISVVIVARCSWFREHVGYIVGWRVPIERRPTRNIDHRYIYFYRDKKKYIYIYVCGGKWFTTYRQGWFSPGRRQQSSQAFVGGSFGPGMHWQDSNPYARHILPVHSLRKGKRIHAIIRRGKKEITNIQRNTHPHKAHEFAIADRLVGFVDGGRAVS